MNIDNEKAFEFMKSIEHVYWQYKAFLKTIKSYKDDSALVSKLSSQFINGTYDKSETRGIHQVVLLAINKLDTPINEPTKRSMAKQMSCVDFYLGGMDIKNKEFDFAVQPFEFLWKYLSRKGFKTNDIDYLIKSEWD